MNKPSENALDQRARRAARRIGLTAARSRWRRDSHDNHGGFMLVNENNCVVAGERFDMSAEDVIAYCRA